MSAQELDVRRLRRPDRHPRIFQEFGDLAVGGSFVLVDSHDPRHLREKFEFGHPGGYGWDCLDAGPEIWRIRITKLAVSGPAGLDVEAAARDPRISRRDYFSDVVRLLPDTTIETDTAPGLEIRLLVLGGSGRLVTDAGVFELRPGVLAQLPQGARPRIAAGEEGLTYLVVRR